MSFIFSYIKLDVEFISLISREKIGYKYIVFYCVLERYVVILCQSTYWDGVWIKNIHIEIFNEKLKNY